MGGLIAQILLARGLCACSVAICPVAPNGMIEFNWDFIKNSMSIANPLKGNEPIMMTPKIFHTAFANTLGDDDAARAFEETATPDSRNVLRDCMGPEGRIDVDAPHRPLLLIGADQDRIIPPHLVEKNFKAYSDKGSVTEFESFAGRSHFICNEPRWQEVAERAFAFLCRYAANARSAS